MMSGNDRIDFAVAAEKGLDPEIMKGVKQRHNEYLMTWKWR